MIRVLLLLIVSVGCTRKIFVPQIRTQITRDTITRVEPDSAMVRALFECDSMGEVRVKELEQYKGEQANQTMDFEKGELRIETRWRTQYIDRVEKVRDTITMVEVQQVTESVPYIPKLFWYTFGGCLLSLGYCVWRVVRWVKR